MAERKQTNQGDVISQLADAGEDALRRLVELPRRTVGGAINRVERRLHEVEERLYDLAARVRAIDPLDSRVAAIEKRLDAIEKQQKTPARRSTRAKPSSARQTRATPAPEPEQEGNDLDRSNDARTGDESERTAATVESESDRPE